ncbi:hypothetical protein AbraCBS73388_009787 [Aspergillus brasiliensis]|uniref:Aminoglycoside phosphotransferase domain-containing protein n=1 Tax=Aspergillus brasiliensis TaxID=319629 RepID=A0A9W6DPX9_9EURO|nr:hypothetical protein AbraCBS73388_009787 [Aspergillus brasiliensis]
MLCEFLSPELLEILNERQEQPQRLDNLWLLSKQAFSDLAKGTVYLQRRDWKSFPDPTRKQAVSIPDASEGIDIDLTKYTVVTNLARPRLYPISSLDADEVVLESRNQLPIIKEELFEIHARFSKSLAWMNVKRHIVSSPDDTTTPGSRMYGPTLSMTVFKLPFGLYLRRGHPMLGSEHQAEAHTLRMIERSTSIPAPRALDVLQTSRWSYLLMTRVPGHPIGQMFNRMTDEQVKQAVEDLKRYVAELRAIPPNTDSEFQICNSLGEGFLDWRIPDSQREELRFQSEAEFNKYLTDPFGEDTRRRAAISHDIPHAIYFTHGDLNPRNILVENGRISGIVDWENAGWFPEYWEYTKAHYCVRYVMRWLVDVVDRVFEGYRDELHVENMLSDLLGPF